MAQRGECGRFGQTGQFSVEAELAFLKRFSQAEQKHVSEPAAQHFIGEKERGLSTTDPTCAVRRDAAAGHNTVQVWMKMKVLPPSVKNGEEPDGRAQTLGIACNREQCFRYGLKQQRIDHTRILQRQSADLLRQREDDVEIGNRQHLALPGLQPLGARGRLTLGAVSVAAGVIRDDEMAARIALLRILGVPAEGRGAAVANRLEGLSLLRTEYVSPVREEILFVRAKDVGHFEPTFVHPRVGGRCGVACTRSSESIVSSGLLVERMAILLTCR